jgi:AraC-like DNA-binding protein
MPATIQPQRALGCVEFASLFQDPLLEEPPAHGAPADVRRRYDQLARQAYVVCAACPLIDECLYRSVVEVDVAGYAGATTPQQRALIRARLKVTVDPEDFDTLAGVTGSHRQVDHAEVVRLRRANPQDSLEDLARRLGCSLSTVKRHLRRERNNPSPPPPHRLTPSHEQVRAVAAEVTGRVAPGAQAA